MKKIVFAGLVTCSLNAHAQVELGAKGGLNITNIVGRNSDYKAKAGVHIGAFAVIPLKGKLSLQPELVYSTQGAKWEGNGDEKTALNYLQIPVLLKYTTPFKLSVLTGPQLGFLLSAKDKYDGKKENIKEYLKTTDFGWQIGIGYSITPNLNANLRYTTSFTNFYEDTNEGVTRKERNSAIQIGLSYLLHKLK